MCRFVVDFWCGVDWQFTEGAQIYENKERTEAREIGLGPYSTITRHVLSEIRPLSLH